MGGGVGGMGGGGGGGGELPNLPKFLDTYEKTVTESSFPSMVEY